MNFKACILFLLYFFERRDLLGMTWHPPQHTSPFALIYIKGREDKIIIGMRIFISLYPIFRENKKVDPPRHHVAPPLHECVNIQTSHI